MKIFFNKPVILISFLLVISSCNNREPKFEYKYNYNPVYTWGQVLFYGQYYSDVNIDLNILTLTLFSDSLHANKQAELAGFGQYLYLEDVFIPLGDTIMPDGIYRADTLAKPFGFYLGEQLEIDGNKFDVGGQMFFVEKRASFSIKKFIARGFFEVSTTGNKQSIVCDFVMTDSTKVTGTFYAQLPYFDHSVSTASKTGRRMKILRP